MRRIAAFPLLLLIAASGCGDEDGTTGVLSFSYAVQPAAATISVDQDFAAAIGPRLIRNGTDTIVGAKFSYTSADVSIANVDSLGNVTGLKGGNTTVVVSSANASANVAVTVRARPALDAVLSILSGPAGGRLTTDNDTGTFYALPGDPRTARLKAVVRLANGDTVFCNYCGTTPARLMRLVNFKSLDTTLAFVTNATQPNVMASTDTSGRVTARDTNSAGVRIVLEVPGDGLADTVTVFLKLRPLDTLVVRPDTGLQNTSTGIRRIVYPGDAVQANVGDSTLVGFIAGVTFQSRVTDLPPNPGSNTTAVRVISLATNISSTNPINRATQIRTVTPVVTWQSANSNYLQINGAGAVTPLCSNIGGASPSAGTCTATGSAVLTCLSPINNSPPPMPATFTGEGTYSVPGCSPARVINPFPGALCTASGNTDVTSMCVVWIKATARDPVFNKELIDRYRINIRR